MRIWWVAAAVLAATPAWAGPDEKPLRVRNDAGRLVRCTLLMDGRYFTDLTLKPGQRYERAFSPVRDLQLVCNRARKTAYGPLELGADYAFVADDNRIRLDGPDPE